MNETIKNQETESPEQTVEEFYKSFAADLTEILKDLENGFKESQESLNEGYGNLDI